MPRTGKISAGLAESIIAIVEIVYLTTPETNLRLQVNCLQSPSNTSQRLPKLLAMLPLTSTAGQFVRCCARQRLPALRASAVLGQHRSVSGTAFPQGHETTKIPNFDHYKSNRSETDNKVFQYVMAGTLGAITAMGAKATVVDFLVNMAPSADVLAQAKVEIDLAAIPEGKNVRGSITGHSVAMY
jgi:hypothetical protein